MSKQNKKILLAEEIRKTLHKNLDFGAAEAYKLLRTNLIYTLPDTEGCRIIGVTSSVRSEGKSTTAVNLSYSLAETGKKVLLIDADMRLPSVAKKLEISNAPGLSDLFVAAVTGRMNVVRSDILPNWYILPAGNIPPNPSELLGSARMKGILQAFEESMDYIILDLPPVNIVADALVVAPLTDGLVVTVRQDYTDSRSLDACIRSMEMAGVKVLGLVLNRVKGEGSRYSRKYYGGRYYKSTSRNDD